jgi:hypothetical protein
VTYVAVQAGNTLDGTSKKIRNLEM